MQSKLFQAMQPVEIVSYFKENTKSLHRIKEIRPYIVYKSIPFDFKKGAVSLFFAEVCRKSIQTAEADTGLYYFLEEMLSFLDSTAEPIHNKNLSIWQKAINVYFKKLALKNNHFNPTKTMATISKLLAFGTSFDFKKTPAAPAV